MTPLDVTPNQMKQMIHCLGMNRKKKPYRNYFYCSSPDPEWEDLVNKGLAKKCGGWTPEAVNYYLTFETVKAIYGKPISQKYYAEM